MTKVAIWCRHINDNIIGIGPQIPWHIPSDFKRFRKMTEGCNLVAGETTYESFPNKTLPNRDIYVLTLNKDYEVSDNTFSNFGIEPVATQVQIKINPDNPNEFLRPTNTNSYFVQFIGILFLIALLPIFIGMFI